jgi:hypothetical protein
MTPTRMTARLAAIVLAMVVLAGCGIAIDRAPRDIDPKKQEELNNP